MPLSVQNYLNSHSDKLKSRADVKRRKTRPWWNFTFALHSNYYHLPKIFSNYRNRTNEFALDENSEFIGFTNTTVIFDTNKEISIKYLLALLNSKVLSFRYQSIGKQTGNGQYEYFENGISKLPIPEIPLSDQIPFINLTDSIMQCKKVQANSKGNDKNKLGEQIINLEKELDRLIYKLYGLSQEDILLIESNLSN
ncbi:TaqI-like C-terminal specificity domain-containing protein [Methanobrevibacter sp.]|uniref:TaqI-like C-terminal specificity domain-containing protein n=1 Tax=Methanobrevibacter sp. TaxID=66852 RepID=UPI00386A0732